MLVILLSGELEAVSPMSYSFKRIKMKKLLYHLVLLWGYVFHHNTKSKVLYYHDISTEYTKQGTSKQLMRSHFEEIRRLGFMIVKNISSPKRQVQICFDDGWAGLYENKDFFIKEGVFPLTFIIISRIGTNGYLTIDQIKELDDLGFQFGSHTWSHKYLSKFDDDGLKHEIVDSKVYLERLLGHSCESICFPMGDYSDRVLKFCKEAGYKDVYSSIRAPYDCNMGAGVICRNLIQDSTNVELKCILKGYSPILRNKDTKREYKA